MKTPMILLNAYMARSNRWLWINATDIGARQAYFMAKAVDPMHAIFEGVTLDDDGQVVWLDSAIAPGFSTYISTANAGNGHVIAARPDNNDVLIVEWAAGTPFYAGSTQTPADKRMFFSAGTEQASGTNVGYGVYDLTAEGQEMFLNAVAYMLGQPRELTNGLVAWWKLDETSGATAYDSVGQDDGVVHGVALWQPTGGRIGGALQFDGVDDYVWLSIGPLISSLTNSSFATWVNFSNTGGSWQRIFDFGSGTSSYMFLAARIGTSGPMDFTIRPASTLSSRDKAPAEPCPADGITSP